MNNASGFRASAPSGPSALRHAVRILLAIVLLAAVATAQPASPSPSPSSPLAASPAPPPSAARAADPAIDPFVSGMLGIIPFTSGLYLTDQPGRGVAFTAIDVLMALGVYSARYTVNGDPDNAKMWFLLMAANNVLDALVSVRAAEHGRLSAFVLPSPEGGMVASLHIRF